LHDPSARGQDLEKLFDLLTDLLQLVIDLVAAEGRQPRES
jgi:hypothetical protein